VKRHIAGNGEPIGRRALIAGLGVAAAAWPLAALGQGTERKARVGAFMNLAEGDAEGITYVTAFAQGLAERGWIVGRNLQIEYRWTAGRSEKIRDEAAQLVALNLDVILTVGGTQVGPLQQLSRTVPIVFVQTADPVGAGFVESLSRPGGNATGFVVFEYGMGGKWLELLKQCAPGIARVAVLRDALNPSGPAFFGAVQSAAPRFGVEVSAVNLRDAAEIERGVTAFAQDARGGLIVTPTSLAIAQRALIIDLAARHRLPAIYPFRYFVTDGGLLYYGPDVVDQYRQAAVYVDRILKGEKPADLPVQVPTKYEMSINLKTAQVLGLDVPQSLLIAASEVIE